MESKRENQGDRYPILSREECVHIWGEEEVVRREKLKEMEQWEIDYRTELEWKVNPGLYTIKVGDMVMQTGKGGYIDYLVEARKQEYNIFDKPALEERLQELTTIPEVGQLELSSFPDIFLKTGVPVPEQVKIPLIYGTSDFEANQGLLAQIEQQDSTSVYQLLTLEKVEELMKDLYAPVPATEDQEKL